MFWVECTERINSKGVATLVAKNKMSVKSAIKNTCLYYRILSVTRSFQKNRVAKQSLEEQKNAVAAMYKERIGRELDWDNLQTYTEKMQWEKLYDKNPLKVTLSDKYLVRNWVANKIGEEYLIPLLGKWDKPAEIEFEELPNQFVLKTNCGSGDVIIIRDKSKLSEHDKKVIKAKLGYYLKCDFGATSYELHYSKIKPCIIAEKFIASSEQDLPDYKFICFGGKVYYCWVDKGRYSNHSRHVYDTDWNFQEWNQMYEIRDIGIPKPLHYEKMLEIARKLSDGFAHVRVDLYNVEGKIYFGEMTFTNGSGFDLIHPYEADL